ncbi:MAG: hypothetical protein ACE5EF_13005 [Dehalococcoidia bacterium]
MEKLVSELAEKFGLPEDQVSKIVGGVIDHLKSNPAAVTELLGGGDGGGGIGGKLGGFLKR